MLPLYLIRAAQDYPMVVEMKNGESFNGHLVSCDNWMNVHLREVIYTNKDGDKFSKMSECIIRGTNLKYIRIPDEVLDNVVENIRSKGRGRGDVKRGGGGAQRGRGFGFTRGYFCGTSRGNGRTDTRSFNENSFGCGFKYNVNGGYFP